MSDRPVHIAALDAALDDGAARYRASRETLWQLKHENAEILRAIDAADKAVRAAKADMEECQEAIRRLHYPVLSAEGGESGCSGRVSEEIVRMNKAENKARCEKGIRL